MTTQIQTATIGGPVSLSYLAPQALAVMGPTLWNGRNEGRNHTAIGGSSLRSALVAGVREAQELTLACRDDTELTFAVHVNEFGILGYTGRIAIVGFTAQTVRGGEARALSYDPAWALWPWGFRADDDIGGCMERWALGVQNMLNGRWVDAVQCLQHASAWTQNIAAREQYLLRRALRTNIALAVRYSHEVTAC